MGLVYPVPESGWKRVRVTHGKLGDQRRASLHIGQVLEGKLSVDEALLLSWIRGSDDGVVARNVMGGLVWVEDHTVDGTGSDFLRE